MDAVPLTNATAVAPIGPVVVGSTLWRSRGRAHLTVIVKTRFALRHNGEMVSTSPPPLVDRDVHIDGDPTRSLVDACDGVPFRESADVWLTGRAHAPAGQLVGVSVVRLAVYRGGEPLLDKALYVSGDRANPDAEPEAFESMPIVYERAYGGIGFDANPVGVGADERMLVPNVIDPVDPERVAGFGPISRYWKLRRRHVSTSVRRELGRYPAVVPDEFDWAYFQAAPADQQLPYLAGDEWLVLDGMHPTLLRVQSRLPGVGAVVRVMSTDPDRADEFEAIAVVADTLAIDADAQTCCISWRGNMALADERQASSLLVAGGIEGPETVVDWQSAHRNGIPCPVPSTRGTSGLDQSGVTIVSEPPSPAPMDELGEDLLGKTSVDPPRHGAEQLAEQDSGREQPVVSSPMMTVPDSVVSYRRMTESTGGPVPTAELEEWPAYSLSTGCDEVTETKTTPVGGLSDDLGAADSSSTHIRLALDTEPGGPPPVDVEELPWLKETAVEPGSAPDAERLQTAPVSSRPEPLEAHAYAEQLRAAGARKGDIQVLLEWLDGDTAEETAAPAAPFPD